MKKAQVHIFTIPPATPGEIQQQIKWEMDADGNHRLIDMVESVAGNWGAFEGLARLNQYVIVSSYWKGIIPSETLLTATIPLNMTKEKVS